MEAGVFVTFWREGDVEMSKYENVKMMERGGKRTIGTMRTKKEATSC